MDQLKTFDQIYDFSMFLISMKRSPQDREVDVRFGHRTLAQLDPDTLQRLRDEIDVVLNHYKEVMHPRNKTSLDAQISDAAAKKETPSPDAQTPAKDYFL